MGKTPLCVLRYTRENHVSAYPTPTPISGRFPTLAHAARATGYIPVSTHPCSLQHRSHLHIPPGHYNPCFPSTPPYFFKQGTKNLNSTAGSRTVNPQNSLAPILPVSPMHSGVITGTMGTASPPHAGLRHVQGVMGVRSPARVVPPMSSL
ncbi:hypothetical protein K435DRAFT_386085 [Dendrothele bispora CBS 962.96]|uniref:Uncharacterized protein n=1 Tax=Dendrothele bispora (strain CBS 962.96) TaxID=1314807 RepID=A0A4S8LA13_DENBC|nr:hypothetical protein K435DRAFT_386085 [Dendrothele bispora CBS 962.96]